MKLVYRWKADQLATTYRCYGTMGTTTPMKESYKSWSQQDGYDMAGRLTEATEPDFPTSGGWGWQHSFTFDTQGRRNKEYVDSASHYQGTYATAAHRYEQLVRQDANSPWFTLSGLTTHYEYDWDGRLTKRYSPADSVVAHVNQQEFPYAAPPGSSTPTAGLDSVMKGARLGDTGEPSVVLVYSYDAENRRIRKEYPGAQVVNFLYGEGKQLLTEELLSYAPRGLDEYVYLGGTPVVMLRSRFDWDGTTRIADWDTAGCVGTGGTTLCGAHLLVHDYLPKPVLAVDSLRRIEGVGEYTPFGQTNKVEWWGEVSPEPVASGTTGLFSGILVPKNGLNLQLRGHFPRWDVRSSAAVGILDENGAWLTYSWGRRYGYGGMGAWTDWVPLTTPTFRVDYYSYTAGWPTPKPQGVSFDGYEYRRYETGAMPYFPPFRFPGQYADVESGLFENWNRFYDPRGSYLSLEPKLMGPLSPGRSANLWGRYFGALSPEEQEQALEQVRKALDMQESEIVRLSMTGSGAYSYARNNPVTTWDPDGLTPKNSTECKAACNFAFQICILTATATCAFTGPALPVRIPLHNAPCVGAYGACLGHCSAWERREKKAKRWPRACSTSESMAGGCAGSCCYSGSNSDRDRWLGWPVRIDQRDRRRVRRRLGGVALSQVGSGRSEAAIGP